MDEFTRGVEFLEDLQGLLDLGLVELDDGSEDGPRLLPSQKALIAMAADSLRLDDSPQD